METFQKSIVSPWNTSESGLMAQLYFYRAMAAELRADCHQAITNATISLNATESQIRNTAEQFQKSLQDLSALVQSDTSDRFEVVDLEAKSCELGNQVREMKERQKFLERYLSSLCKYI